MKFVFRKIYVCFAGSLQNHVFIVFLVLRERYYIIIRFHKWINNIIIVFISLTLYRFLVQHVISYPSGFWHIWLIKELRDKLIINIWLLKHSQSGAWWIQNLLLFQNFSIHRCQWCLRFHSFTWIWQLSRVLCLNPILFKWWYDLLILQIAQISSHLLVWVRLIDDNIAGLHGALYLRAKSTLGDSGAHICCFVFVFGLCHKVDLGRSNHATVVRV